VITPTLFILLILSIFGYLYANVQRKLMHLSWSDQKCNPRYLFFSGLLDPWNKNPWISTQDNFNRCVSTNIYKDPAMTKEIKNNHSNILKHQNETRQNLLLSDRYVKSVNKKWEDIQNNTQHKIYEANTANENVFEEQGVLYKQILMRTSQMYHVLSSIARYIQGILLYTLSTRKTKLGIEDKHMYFMKKYDKIYQDYSEAYRLISLKVPDYPRAINHARTAIEDYTILNQELEDYMKEHYQDVYSITEGCYQLKNNLEDDSCNLIFPNLDPRRIATYPNLAEITKGVL